MTARTRKARTAAGSAFWRRRAASAAVIMACGLPGAAAAAAGEPPGNAPVMWERETPAASASSSPWSLPSLPSSPSPPSTPSTPPSGARPPAARPVAGSPHCAECAALPARKANYAGLIEAVSAEFGLDAALLHAIVSTESGYDPSAVSSKGAIGLMQVLPATGRRFGFAGLQDPRTNLLAGATYLKWLLERFHGNVTLAVAAYNSGESAVERYGGAVPPYEETRRYVATVMAKYQAARTGAVAEAAHATSAALWRPPVPGAASAAAAAGTVSATGAAGAPGTASPAQAPAGSGLTPWRLLAKLGTLLVSAPPAERG